jgi:formylglycine-generating enzyme required for sulfatase activity
LHHLLESLQKHLGRRSDEQARAASEAVRELDAVAQDWKQIRHETRPEPFQRHIDLFGEQSVFADLARDRIARLHVFRKHGEIVVQPEPPAPGPVERAVDQARTNPTLAIVAAGILALALLVLAITSLFSPTRKPGPPPSPEDKPVAQRPVVGVPPPQPPPAEPGACHGPPQKLTHLARFCDKRGTEMIVIEGGTLRMGSEAGSRHEKPVRDVTIARFAIGVKEVTVAEWQACVAEKLCRPLPSSEDGRLPVRNITWRDVVEGDGRYRGFLAYLNGKLADAYRLPSEAEWEFAARGGVSTKFSWGDQWDADKANAANRRRGPEPVGAYLSYGFGLHDVHGNVWEMVADCWHDTYLNAPLNQRAWRSENGGDCSLMVIRGGAWDSFEDRLRLTARHSSQRNQPTDTIGFRVARSLPAEPAR